MEKLSALLALFRKGVEVSDPTKWREMQVTVNALGAALLALVEVLRAFGIVVPITEAQSLALGGGVIAVVNIVLTIIASRDVGLPDRRKSNEPVEDDQRKWDQL